MISQYNKPLLLIHVIKIKYFCHPETSDSYFRRKNIETVNVKNILRRLIQPSYINVFEKMKCGVFEEINQMTPAGYMLEK